MICGRQRPICLPGIATYPAPTPRNALRTTASKLSAEYLAADYTVLLSARAHIAQRHCALTFQLLSRAEHGERGHSIPTNNDNLQDNTLYNLTHQ